MLDIFRTPKHLLNNLLLPVECGNCGPKVTDCVNFTYLWREAYAICHQMMSLIC